MSYKRSDRVGGVIHETFSRILVEDIRDPRLKNVNVTRCELSHDLKYAKVFFSLLINDTPEKRKEALLGMKAAKGYYKRELGRKCGLRIVPELSFSYDDTTKQSIHMNELFKQIHKEEKQDIVSNKSKE